jgi:hypothetical protein
VIAPSTPSATGILSVSLAVRPARLVVLVPSVKGLSWLAVFESALAAQCQFWGGQANIIVPTDPGYLDNPVLWELLDRQDPDAFVLAALSVADMEFADPRWYQSWLAAQHAALERDFPDMEPGEREATIQRLLESTAVEPSLADEDQQVLAARLGVLGADHKQSFDWVSGSNGPAWPWMDAAELEEVPEAITNPVISNRLGFARRLWAAAQHGRVAHALRRALADRGVRLQDRAINNRRDWGRWLLQHRNEERLPWTLGEQGVEWYRRGGLRDSPPTLVVGDSAWDFALFYALRRWTSQAWWLPSWLARDQLYRFYLDSELRSARRCATSDVAVVTTGTRLSARDRIVQELNNEPNPIRADTAQLREVLPAQPQRYYEWGSEGTSEPIPLLHDRTPPLPTPTPKRVSARNPLSMHWITEVRVDNWTPVRSDGIGSRVLLSGTGGYERTSTVGPAYFCPNVVVLGGQTLESAVVRPALAPLPVLDQLRSLLRPSGRDCRLSDKGIYAAETVSLFGDIDACCSGMRDGAIRPLLDEYGEREAKRQRPYLSLENVRGVIGDRAEEITERLADRGVLLRGLLLKCERCRQENWYALGELSERYRCRRCFTDQAIKSGLYLGKGEPAWTYRLAEVVRHFLANNGDLPLLAIWDRFGASDYPLDVGHEIEVLDATTGKTLQEVDIVVAHGYELWLGEATTTGSISVGRLRKLRRLAGDTGALGVLLATSTRGFKSAVRTTMRNLFPDPWPRTELRTAVDRKPG